MWFSVFAFPWFLTPVIHLLQLQDLMKGMKGKEASPFSIIAIRHLNSRKTKKKIREVDELKHTAKIGFSYLLESFLNHYMVLASFLVLLGHIQFSSLLYSAIIQSCDLD